MSVGKSDKSFVTKAQAAWGDAVPDWVAELAIIADAEGLDGAGKRLGNTGSLVSGVINNKYGGNLGAVEERVRWALMSQTVDCPILGEIDRNRCLEEQQEPFRATSAFRAQLFHACRNGCPNARPQKGNSNGSE
jgi:hypothetical protein